MVPCEAVESGSLEHYPLSLLLLLVAHILYDSVTQQSSTHVRGLLSLHAAVESLEAVGKEAVHHAASTETLAEPLESVKVATRLQTVFEMRDDLGVHDCGREVGPLVFVSHVQSDTESSGQASLSRRDGHPGRGIVCSDAVPARAPAGVVGSCHGQRYWSWRSCGRTAAPLSVHFLLEFHL